MKALVFIVLIIGIAYASPFCSPLDLIHRTIDGECNNILDKGRGKTGSFFKTGLEGRELYEEVCQYPLNPPPTYDSISEIPSDGIRGNARDISNKFATRHDPDAVDENRSSMLATMFGQFITHDLDSNRMENAHILGGSDLITYFLDQDDWSCQETQERPVPHPYRCNDEDKVLTNAVKRSVGVRQADGTIKVYNNATSFLDLDQVYGRTKEIASKLRLKTGGKLLYLDSTTFNVTGPGYEYETTLENLPPTYSMVQVPVDPLFATIGDPTKFVVAGDERINENIALMFFHIIFLREHNRVCDELINSNLIWKLLPGIFDEEIYQRARAITIAKYQHIIYEQFIPSSYGSFADKLESYSGYKFNEDPTTSSVFADVALRYGHFTPRPFSALDACGVAIHQNKPAEDPNHKQQYIGFLNPTPLNMTPLGRISEAGGLGNIARGLVSEIIAPVDFNADNVLRNFTGGDGAFDLATIDIVRGRFNTIPNYQKVRSIYYGSDDDHLNKIYGSPGCPSSLEYQDDEDDTIECFLLITSKADRAQLLKDHYGKVKYVDAVVGAMMEDPAEGSSFGPTNGNILIDQFRRTRDGDRFFYRSLISSLFFSSSQKDEILSTTMGSLLRRNLEEDDSVSFPDNPFKVPENYRETLGQQC